MEKGIGMIPMQETAKEIGKPQVNVVNQETYIPMGVACLVAVFVLGILWKVSQIKADIQKQITDQNQALALAKQKEDLTSIEESKKITELFGKCTDMNQRLSTLEGKISRRGDTRS